VADLSFVRRLTARSQNDASSTLLLRHRESASPSFNSVGHQDGRPHAHHRPRRQRNRDDRTSRYRFECGLSFVLLYHCGSQYWPQGSPVFDRTRHTWEKEVYVKRVGNDRHFISVASLDVDARPLFDHYYRLGETKREWHPITLYALPSGVTVLHSIRVQPEVA